MLLTRDRARDLRPVPYAIIEKNQSRPKSARPNLSIVRGVAEISAKDSGRLPVGQPCVHSR
jgi:hypothetical protein